MNAGQIGKTSRCMAIVLIIALMASGCGTSEASEGNQASEGCTMKMRITLGDVELVATMLDSQASRDFMAMLPLTLQLKDYANTEKVSDLPKRLSTKGAAPGYDPSRGDITYYAPWGNLAIFYKDFGYAQGLVKLGHIDGGIEQLTGRQTDFEARFESLPCKD